MPNVFDTLDQSSSQPSSQGKRNVFDDVEQESSDNMFTGTTRGLLRGGVQFGKGIVGAIPPVAAFDIASSVNAPKVLTEEAKEKYKEQSFFKPIAPEQEETRKLNVTSSGLIEMATGVGHPENTFEKAALWAGYLKSPKAPQEFTKAGIDLMSRPDRWKEIAKSFAPTGKEASSAIGAGLFMQAAEDGQWGPMGQLAAGIVGSMVGHAAPSFGKGIGKFAQHPIVSTKEAAARMTAAVARFGNPEKLRLQQELIRTFRESGIQADLGSITGSNLMKTIQARLASSGLVGGALDKFRTQITEQIVHQTKELAEGVGQSRFQNFTDLDNAILYGLKGIEETESAIHRELYQGVEEKAKDAVVSGFGLSQKIANLEEKLLPGSVKSTEQSAVLKALEDLKKDIYDAGDVPKPVRVRDLMNSKKGIQDKINYEVKGGAKQLLKDIVREIDNAIMDHAKADPEFGRMLKEANSRFGRHVATYRNKDIASLMRGENSASAMAKMNTVQGIRRLERALGKTHEGQKLFNEMKRAKFDQIVTNNMVDGVTNQFKLGRFTNLLEKGKNRELIKEILGPGNFARLERLQKSTGALAESAQKFFNASKSGTTVIDFAVGAKALSDMGFLLAGNPWPFAKTVGGFTAVRSLARMITDPVFLKMIEDGMLAGKAGKTSRMSDYFAYATRPLRESEEYTGQGTIPETTLTPEQQASGRMQTTREKVGMNQRTFREAPREGLSEDITNVNPEYSEKYLEPYLKEPPLMQSKKYSKQHKGEMEGLNLGKWPELSPGETKINKQSWKKMGLPESLSDSYYKFGSWDLNPFATIGDFVIDPIDKVLLKDVLDIPVRKYLSEDSFGAYSPVNKEIIINPRMHPEQVYDTMAHEAWHALQDFKGRLLWDEEQLKYVVTHPGAYPKRNYPQTHDIKTPKGQQESYFKDESEIAARKKQRRSMREINKRKKREIKIDYLGRGTLQ